MSGSAAQQKGGAEGRLRCGEGGGVPTIAQAPPPPGERGRIQQRGLGRGGWRGEAPASHAKRGPGYEPGRVATCPLVTSGRGSRAAWGTRLFREL